MEVVAELRESAKTKELAEVAGRAAELEERVVHVVDALSEGFGRAYPPVRKALDAFLRSKRVPELEGRALHEASGEIREYSERLEEYIEELSSFASKLHELDGALRELDRERRELERWRKTAEELDKGLCAEVDKLLRNARRILEEEGLDVDGLLSEARQCTSEIARARLRCKALHQRKLSELRELVKACEKLYRWARGLAELEERGRVEATRKRVESAREALGRGEMARAERVLRECLEYYRSVVADKLGTDEGRVLSALAELSGTLEGRGLQLHALVQLVSKRTGLSVSSVLRALVSLSRRGLLGIKVRLE